MRLLISVCLIVFVASPVRAQTDDEIQRFDEAYRAYNDAYAEARFGAAARHGAEALRLAEDLMADRPDQIALMTLNLGDAYLHALKFDDAERTLELAIERYRAAFGEKDDRVARPMLELGKLYDKKGESPYLTKAKRLYRDVLDLYEDIYGKHHPILSEPLRRLAYNALLAGRPGPAKGYLKRAVSITREAGPDFAADHALNLFEMGKYEMVIRDNGDARDIFLEVLGLLKSLDPPPALPLAATHAFLVEVYERMNESEKATEHVQQLALLEPATDRREPQPLFRSFQKYPFAALSMRREGHVLVRFTIDREGRVKDPEVIGGENERFFRDAALEAVARYRYKPRIVNGEFVESKGHQVKLVWVLEGR